jgi:hypothetical protein
MSPGRQYNANLLPDTREKWFWSSSPHGDSFAFGFIGNDGGVDYHNRHYIFIVRCVRDGRVNPQVPAQVPNVAPAPAAAVVEAPQNEGVPRLMQDPQRVNPAFAALGNMYEAAGLIWSGVAPREMNWQEAINYCANLGGGARLPTTDEYGALSRAMSLGRHYNANLLPDTLQKWFWSSSPHGENLAHYFNGFDGNVYHRYRISDFSVRCVQDGHANPQLPADVPNAAPAPAAVARAPEIAQALQNEGVPQPMRDVNRVNLAFAALGNMYEAAGLIWSGVAPQRMNWQDAKNYCSGLGEGSRLPTADEYRALIRAMSPGGRYNIDLVPDTSGKWFWSSSPRGDHDAFFFDADHGNVNEFFRLSAIPVRCVRIDAMAD